MKGRTLITSPGFDNLGKELINWKGGSLEKADVSFGQFPDGWPNLFIHRVEELLEHREVTLIGDFADPKNVFPLYALATSITGANKADKLRIIMPWFPVGTMEREVKRGEIPTAKPFARIFSHIPPGRVGKTSIHTLDIHDIREKDFFDEDKVNFELHTAMHLVETEGYDAICFPDKGAADRFKKYFTGREIIICEKIREGTERKMRIVEGDPKGKKVLIVDDMIQSGSTTIKCADIMREAGAQLINAFATHGVFPDNAHLKVVEAVDNLIVTDTIPANHQRAEGIEKMKVISIAPLVNRIIEGEQ